MSWVSIEANTLLASLFLVLVRRKVRPEIRLFARVGKIDVGVERRISPRFCPKKKIQCPPFRSFLVLSRDVLSDQKKNRNLGTGLPLKIPCCFIICVPVFVRSN